MQPAELHRARDIALAASREAAELLREGFRSEPQTQKKGGVELVTEYDGRSEALLVAQIARAFPEHRVVGEELGQQGAADTAAPCWYVDPLDGTVNFAHHLPWYAISIGLEWKGRGLMGMVVAPELGWELIAIDGEGTWLNGQRVHVSQTETLQDAVVATGFPYRRDDFDNTAQLKAALARCRGLRRMGTASLDCLAVACGWMDAYWEFRLQPWDVSGGAICVREAGGTVSAVDGAPYRAGEGQILCSNGRIHRALQELLSPLPPPPEARR
jgi:myo-inositol-1(or 4)-monophosphatase